MVALYAVGIESLEFESFLLSISVLNFGFNGKIIFFTVLILYLIYSFFTSRICQNLRQLGVQNATIIFILKHRFCAVHVV